MSKLNQINQEMEQAQTELRQLQNRQKVLLNKKSVEERKARAHRLIPRGAILESAFPTLVPMENEEISALLFEVSRLPEVQKLLSKAVETIEAE